MRRISRHSTVVALVSLAGTSACSLVWSTADFTSAPEASAPDGGGAAEGGSRGSVDGAVVARDATTDTGATGGTFCTSFAQAPTFCIDFDAPNAPPGFKLLGYNAPPPVVEPGSGTAGNALAATIAPATECTSDGEWSGGPATFSKFRGKFAVRHDGDAQASTQVYSFLFKSGATVHRILVAIDQGMLAWNQELDYAPNGTTFAKIPLNGATGYIPVTFEGACDSRTVDVTVGGKATQTTLSTAPSGSCGRAELRFGVYYNGPAEKAKKVYFDDVALWLE